MFVDFQLCWSFIQSSFVLMWKLIRQKLFIAVSAEAATNLVWNRMWKYHSVLHPRLHDLEHHQTNFSGTFISRPKFRANPEGAIKIRSLQHSFSVFYQLQLASPQKNYVETWTLRLIFPSLCTCHLLALSSWYGCVGLARDISTHSGAT